MGSKAGSVVLIMGGVVLVYLAATGYAGGVWDALKGPKGSTSDPTVAAQGTQTGGGASRALGRGMGGAVSDTPVAHKGVFYASASGGMMASDQGVW